MLKTAISLHRLLAWFAGIGLLVWGLSGLLHPLMTTFGPQQLVYRAPAAALALEGMLDAGEILRRAGIDNAVAVQMVVTGHGNVLQVTESSLAPRRYFDVHSGEELADHDRRYAEYLARHYLGAQVEPMPVQAISLQDHFDLEYPQVNRLLPVWRIDFEGDGHLTAYVHTETASLAAVNDDFKRVMQTGFQWFHTWDWMPDRTGWLRVALTTLLVGSIFCLCISGVVMLLRIHRKGTAPGLRGWHRIGAWMLVLPVFMLSGSGLYHLWLMAIDPPQSFLRHGAPLDLAGVSLPLGTQWREVTEGLPVDRLSLVRNAEGELLYRLGLSAQGSAPEGEKAIRNARFDGVPATGPALYLDAMTGQPWQPGDRELALQIAEYAIGLPRSAVTESSLLTRFGVDYDFRNKRVPVWRLSYGEPHNIAYFVDTATGVLVDAVESHEQPERLSFSLLHKWSFLMMIGRDVQNVAISVAVVAAIGFLAIPGLLMRWRRRVGSAL
ncbi:MAG: PepSY domain-containing protein [Gammaproteobacteria bacterium]|nr:PepSY domain-containing protein [Gammaproteobacteria bacterium]